MTENHLNKKREGLRSWFHRDAKPLVKTYEAALHMLEDKNFPDRILLIAHAIREINNSLPEILDAISKRHRMEYGPLVDKILPNWPTQPSLNALEIDEAAEKTVNISLKVAFQIDDLIQTHRKNNETPNQFDTLFRILKRKHPLNGDVNLKIIKDFKDMHRKFTKWSKKRSLIETQPTEDELHKQFCKFEDTLFSFVGSFFEGTERLDELMKKGIHPDQIDGILPLIASPDHEAYFFNNLNDHKLIPHLKKKGMFNTPFKTENLKGGGIRYPNWPPSRYLSRMAKAAPDEVTGIFSLMKTDNSSVVRDIIDAALAIPVKSASKLVPVICIAAKADLLHSCFEKAGSLCVKLAEEGEAQSAEMLSIAVYTPRLKTYNRRSWDEHQHTEGLEKLVPVLTASGESSKFLTKLCEWHLLFVKREKRVVSENNNDNSDLWRPAIEDHSENPNYHRASPMVNFVRDGFQLAIENNNMDLEAALKILDTQKSIIFERIKLYLINAFAEKSHKIAREAIMNSSFFNQCEYKHEYAKLLECHFSLLEETEQSEWFSWVDNGPKTSDRRDLGNSISEEQRSSSVRYWKYNKLHWTRLHLKATRKEAYDALRLEFGELQLPDLNISYNLGMIRDENTIKIEDLSKLSFMEVIEKLVEYQPSSQPPVMRSETEQLSATFKEYVTTRAKAFSSDAKFLIGCPAIFVRKFISSMTQEVKMVNDIDISPVLDLCLWVVSRPIDECTTPGQGEIGFIDKDWSWTMSDIAQFIRAVCESVENNSPKYQLQEFHTKIWQIISRLCEQRKETVDIREIDDDPLCQDYIQTGINSLSGQSMEAAIEYTRWVFNNHKLSGNKISFADLPEVKQLFESRITATNSNPGELAMIGSNIHLIYAIDKPWLEANADILFPLDSNETISKANGWAAWNAFLSCSRPHIEFYKLFRKQFTYAATQVLSIPVPQNSSHNPAYRIGEHLAILYIRGEMALDEESLSIKKYLSNSSFETRRHTIGFAGRLLEPHEEITEKIRIRCQNLWESYWADNGEDDSKETSGSWPFESWLSSKKFPKTWSLEQFEKYLQATEAPEISSFTMDELAEIADADLKKAVNILSTIVKSDKEGWHIPGWQDSAYSILEKAVRADKNCDHSLQLIDYLGRSGYMKFKKLIL